MDQSTITLPQALQERLEVAAEKFLYTEPGIKDNFLHPSGEPALLAPDSVSWRVFKNPVALFIGGVAAVILELAEPRVRTGVWEHTAFRRDPVPRLRRTGLAAMMTVYGPRSKAESMAAGVRRMHDRVSGLTPGGIAYRANDPELLNWVHATAGFGFLQAYARYAFPLDANHCRRFHEEGRHTAHLYGVSDAPASQAEMNAFFNSMRDRLEPSAIVFEFLDVMLRVPLLPPPARPIQSLLVKAAVDIVPPWIRERLALSRRWDLPRWQRRIVMYATRAADRVVLRSSPAVQACRRLGLTDAYLYRQRPGATSPSYPS